MLKSFQQGSNNNYKVKDMKASLSLSLSLLILTPIFSLNASENPSQELEKRLTQIEQRITNIEWKLKLADKTPKTPAITEDDKAYLEHLKKTLEDLPEK